MTQIDIEYHKRFLREKRKLMREYPSIENDFEDFKTALITDIRYNNYSVPHDNKKYFRITGLDETVSLPAFLGKAFYCEKMNKGSNSGFRVTFIYDPSENLILFIQFYHEDETKIDKERINHLFKI